MESGLITELRTAAGTAVALDQLARRDARRLLVCGAGAQVLPHVEAIAAIRDLETVQLWGRTAARTQATLTEIRTRFPHLHASLADDLRTATQDADLIACLTPATEPYLQLADVRPGITATPALRQPYTRIRHSATTVGLSDPFTSSLTSRLIRAPASVSSIATISARPRHSPRPR